LSVRGKCDPRLAADIFLILHDRPAHHEHQAAVGGDGEFGITEIDPVFLQLGRLLPGFSVTRLENPHRAVWRFVFCPLAKGAQPAILISDQVGELIAPVRSPNSADRRNSRRAAVGRGEYRRCSAHYAYGGQPRATPPPG
jgi:hypothetical protein